MRYSLPRGRLKRVPLARIDLCSDVLTNTLKIGKKFQIGIPQHFDPMLGEKCIPHAVLPFAFFRKMLTAVRLDHKFCRSTIKIKNILPDDLLSAYGFRKIF